MTAAQLSLLRSGRLLHTATADINAAPRASNRQALSRREMHRQHFSPGNHAVPAWLQRLWGWF